MLLLITVNIQTKDGSNFLNTSKFILYHVHCSTPLNMARSQVTVFQ